MFRVLNQVEHMYDIYISMSKHTSPNLKALYILYMYFCRSTHISLGLLSSCLPTKKSTHPKQQQQLPPEENPEPTLKGSTFLGCQVKVGRTIRILMEASPSGYGMEFSRPQKMGGEDLNPQLNEFDGNFNFDI